MRLKTEDTVLLKHIHGTLTKHEETDLALRLNNMIRELESKQKKEREANRVRAAKYRGKGEM